MLNFIYAELWRVLRRPLGKISLILMAVLPVLLNLICFAENLTISSISVTVTQPGGYSYTTTDTAGIAGMLMPFAGVLFLMAIVDLSFSDETRLGTMKNNICAGIPRSTVYFGKVLSGGILGILHFFTGWLCYWLSVPLLPDGQEALSALFEALLWRSAALFPLWLGMLALLYFLYFTFSHGLTAVVILGTASIFAVPILYALQLPFAQFVEEIHLAVWFSRLTTESMSAISLWECWVVGVSYTVVFLFAGWMLFRRKECR